ncbi:MAG: putative epoxide hydrolase [Acidimicrobiia bacterium]|nr:putative epoxide hydrolase [Acidimicrobiia bacterium]
MGPTPFRVDIPQADLDDLSERLRRTRWPEQEPVQDFSQGVPKAWLQDICQYWLEGYDWRRFETELNQFPQFRHTVDGLGIHFIHVRSAEPGALPLILTHGWPGSIVEFLKVIGPLTDPVAHGGNASDAFHVVVPSLPGYGFSDKPTETGWNIQRIARAWARLMADLGYDRYFAQGGDWGSGITASIGEQDPEHCMAIHVNIPACLPNEEQMASPTPEELVTLGNMAEHQRWGTGYSQEQMTRPQTIGYSLVDSPVGQAAWILEKFWVWTDCDGNPENALTRDELLDNLSLYWFTATGASSARLYWESFETFSVGGPVTVPTGVTNFPKEVALMPRRWAENRFTDIRYWHDAARGGHFASFEQPEIFVDELRTYYRLFR